MNLTYARNYEVPQAPLPIMSNYNFQEGPQLYIYGIRTHWIDMPKPSRYATFEINV